MYFNEFLYMANKYKFPIIANEFYFQKPSILSEKPDLQAMYNQDYIKSKLYYIVPKDKDVDVAWKHIIPDEFCKRLSLEYGGINNTFVHLMTERDTSFETLLEGFISDIINRNGEQIKAFITIINFPSLDYIAKRNGVKVIHFEVGCFRMNEYRNTAMLSEYSLYSKENTCEMSKKFEAYIHELNSSKRKLLTNKQILSLFLCPDKLGKLDLYDKQPQYEIGCALGWSEDVRYMLLSNYDHSELLYTANEAFGSNEVLTRLHPHNPAGALYPRHIKNKDKSASPVEFIVKCKRVASVMSNVSNEAAFWGRSPYTFLHCPSYYMSQHSFDTLEPQMIEQNYLNWYAFCWLFPNELLYDPEYLYWRLSNPSELELYDKHLDFYLKQDRLPRKVLNMSPNSSIKVIRHMRKLFGKKD
jgi:hypothetical protein